MFGFLKKKLRENIQKITRKVEEVEEKEVPAKIEVGVEKPVEKKETIKEEIFDLKKEIKVLRRERDHYKKIVKEKNLL